MIHKLKFKFALFAGAFAMVLVVACGDNELYSPDEGAFFVMADSLASSECNAGTEGSMVFVKSASEMYACSDGEWIAMNGQDRKTARCESLPLKDSSGFIVVCDGDTVSIARDGEHGANGKDGKDGQNGSNGNKGDNGKDGIDGTSCTAKAWDDGKGYDLVCNGKVVGSVKNGADGATIKGAKGDDCKGEVLESGNIRITCGTTVVGELEQGKTGNAGENGEGCTARASDAGDGYDLVCEGTVVGSIGNGSDGMTIIGPKGENCQGEVLETGDIRITCGGEYVGELKMGQNAKGCSFVDNGDGTIKFVCGNNDDEAMLYKAMCGTTPYDPATQACTENNVIKPLCSALAEGEQTDCADQNMYLPLCGVFTYNPKTHGCTEHHEIQPLCGVEMYDPQIQSCCGTEVYNLADQFCDDRDSQVYRYTKIENEAFGYSEIWMAQNLNYDYPVIQNRGSYCYDNEPQYCKIYGRLYSWNAVVDSAGLIDSNGVGVGCGTVNYMQYREIIKAAKYIQGVCPTGWHVAREREYLELFEAVSNTRVESYSTSYSPGRAYLERFTSAYGWDNYHVNGTIVSGNGWDDFGLAILPSGYRSRNGKFVGMGKATELWGIVSENTGNAAAAGLQIDSVYFRLRGQDLQQELPVRCVKNKD